MMKCRNIVFLWIIFLIAFSFTGNAQGIKDIRINEILVKNADNYQDAYGVKSGWFELYNSGYSTVSLGGCYLTNDRNDSRKYRIPKNDQRTSISPQNYVIFFAYNDPTRGTFHVNFDLEETGYIALYDQSGKILIDSVSYDVAAQKEDVSIGKLENVENPEWKEMDRTTPAAINNVFDQESRSELYSRKDKHGLIITITSMSVVFFLLLLIAVVFKCLGYFFKKRENKKKETPTAPTSGKLPEEEIIITNASEDDDVIAAITTALYLYYNDLHEVEPNGFWINRPLNHQSPWANKSLVFKRTPNKK